MSDEAKESVQRVIRQFEHAIVGVNQRHIGDITGEIGENYILKIGEAISI